MSEDTNTRSIRMRRYQGVTDRVSRRIYKFDRWRIPWAGGLPVSALVYFAVTAATLALAAQLPIVGSVLGLLPFSLLYVGIPGLAAWVLSSFKLDGRPPHKAALALFRWRVRARVLAGLRPAPEIGTEIAPVSETVVVPSGDEASYRRGRIRGPAKITFRYPARLHPERVAARHRSASKVVKARNAKRLRLEPAGAGARPEREALTVRIRADQEVVVG
jgi:hypothetical protein